MQNEKYDDQSPYDYSDENVRRAPDEDLTQKDEVNKIEELSQDEDVPKKSGPNPRLGQRPTGNNPINKNGTGLDLDSGANQGKVPAG